MRSGLGPLQHSDLALRRADLSPHAGDLENPRDLDLGFYLFRGGIIRRAVPSDEASTAWRKHVETQQAPQFGIPAHC
jgi:hypothetical protein